MTNQNAVKKKFRSILFENDPNAHGVGGEVLTKREMARKFIHNSQRAYWDGRVSDWASNVAVPAAMNAVTVALTTGRAIV